MKQSRWLRLMEEIQFQPNQNSYDQLVNLYGERHRKYHNSDHLDAVLKLFDKVSHLAQDRHAIELALWFHDAIYNIFSKTNELDSAVLAREFIISNCDNSDFADSVYAHIIATEHNFLPKQSDAKLIVDIDLAILGCDKPTYDSFESNIRKEYRLIPWFVYKKKRAEILKGFLDRERIYSHQFFIESFEENARINIGNAISDLQSAESTTR